MSKLNKNDILKKLQELKPKLEQEFKITKLGLFGSYARDEAKEDSDVDLLFEINNKKFDMFDFLNMKSKLEDELHKRVDLIKENGIKDGLKKYIYTDILYV